MQGKVSLITPCYNGSNYIDSYIRNITLQIYPNMEVIFVDDGSTDETRNKYELLRTAVEKKGYEFKLLRKENGGPASAVNCALKQVTGEYIMLLDMDDELYEGAVSEKAEFLNNNLEYDIVISNGYYKFEDKPRRHWAFTTKLIDESTIFERMLKIDFYNWPGSYMIRRTSFEEMNGEMSIYESPYGQNLQMILPALCRNRVAFINKYLMDYNIKRNSLSHTNDKLRMVELVNGYEDIRKNVINRIKIDGEKKKKYIRIIEIASAKEKMRYACRTYNKNELRRQFEILGKLEAIDKSDRRIYRIGQHRGAVLIYKAVNHVYVIWNHIVI